MARSFRRVCALIFSTRLCWQHTKLLARWTKMHFRDWSVYGSTGSPLRILTLSLVDLAPEIFNLEKAASVPFALSYAWFLIRRIIVNSIHDLLYLNKRSSCFNPLKILIAGIALMHFLILKFRFRAVLLVTPRPFVRQCGSSCKSWCQFEL